MSVNAITYRGFEIAVSKGDTYPYRVFDTFGAVIYSARTEALAYDYIDEAKRKRSQTETGH